MQREPGSPGEGQPQNDIEDEEEPIFEMIMVPVDPNEFDNENMFDDNDRVEDAMMIPFQLEDRDEDLSEAFDNWSTQEVRRHRCAMNMISVEQQRQTETRRNRDNWDEQTRQHEISRERNLARFTELTGQHWEQVQSIIDREGERRIEIAIGIQENEEHRQFCEYRNNRVEAALRRRDQEEFNEYRNNWVEAAWRRREQERIENDQFHEDRSNWVEAARRRRDQEEEFNEYRNNWVEAAWRRREQERFENDQFHVDPNEFGNENMFDDNDRVEDAMMIPFQLEDRDEDLSEAFDNWSTQEVRRHHCAMNMISVEQQRQTETRRNRDNWDEQTRQHEISRERNLARFTELTGQHWEQVQSIIDREGERRIEIAIGIQENEEHRQLCEHRNNRVEAALRRRDQEEEFNEYRNNWVEAAWRRREQERIENDQFHEDRSNWVEAARRRREEEEIIRHRQFNEYRTNWVNNRRKQLNLPIVQRHESERQERILDQGKYGASVDKAPRRNDEIQREVSIGAQGFHEHEVDEQPWDGSLGQFSSQLSSQFDRLLNREHMAAPRIEQEHQPWQQFDRTDEQPWDGLLSEFSSQLSSQVDRLLNREHVAAPRIEQEHQTRRHIDRTDHSENQEMLFDPEEYNRHIQDYAQLIAGRRRGEERPQNVEALRTVKTEPQQQIVKRERIETQQRVFQSEDYNIKFEEPSEQQPTLTRQDEDMQEHQDEQRYDDVRMQEQHQEIGDDSLRRFVSQIESHNRRESVKRRTRSIDQPRQLQRNKQKRKDKETQRKLRTRLEKEEGLRKEQQKLHNIYEANKQKREQGYSQQREERRRKDAGKSWRDKAQEEQRKEVDRRHKELCEREKREKQQREQREGEERKREEPARKDREPKYTRRQRTDEEVHKDKWGKVISEYNKKQGE